MKVVLINPPISGYNDRDLFESEPLGLAYLAAYLEKEGFNVEILDCFARGLHQVKITNGLLRKGLSDQEIIKYLREINPDVIGIHSNFTMFYPDAKNVALVARTLFPDRPIIFGGAHATMDAKNIVQSYAADIVVRSEGEETATELLKAIEGRASYEGIAGITYRDKNGNVRSNVDRALLVEIESLPDPAWHKLDMDIYLKNSRSHWPFAKRHPAATIMTSRGCPNNCIFCSTKTMWRRGWRADSAQKVVRQIEHLVRNYGVKEVIFQDDNFLVDCRRVEQILDLLKEKGFDITMHIQAGFTQWLVDERILRRMKEVGFYRLGFPVETGNKKTLKFIRKPVNLNKVLDQVRAASRLGFWTQTNFIIGFPYETREDILETIQYAFRSGFDFVAFLIAQPFAGAEMFEIYMNEGLLNSEVLNKRSIFFKTQIDTKYLKAHEIQDLRDWAARQYIFKRIQRLFNPKYFFTYFWPKINSGEKFIYILRITFQNFNYIFNRYRSKDIR